MPSEGRKLWNFRGAEANKVREVKSPKRHSPAWCKSRDGRRGRRGVKTDGWKRSEENHNSLYHRISKEIKEQQCSPPKSRGCG